LLNGTKVRILTPAESLSALALKAKNILELGVRGGATTMPLLLAAKEVRLLASIF
jgi:predicted O-methyltransferase YrrM